MLRTLLLSLALTAIAAAPAWAQDDPFTVTGADGTVQRGTAEEMAHWVDIAMRSGGDRASARMNALQLLVGYAWLRGEAAERGIVITHERVVRAFRRQREATFPDRRAYRRYLREAGQTTGDVLLRVRMDLVSTAIRNQVIGGASVSDAEVDAHLAEHGVPRLPERRDLRIVLTRRRSTAVAAKRELLAGASWSSVARRYSIDDASRQSNARLPDVVRGTLERPLDRAAFSARPGRVVGPVRTQFGYYIFRVTRIHPAYDMPIEQAREQARFQLLSEKQLAVLDAFVTEFRAKWRARTVCARGWRTQRDCGN